MTAIDNSMKILNQQWYNALVNALNLDSNTFQLVQGSMSLGYNSEKIWNILDSIPPNSVNYYFDPAGYNSFSQTYSSIINNLNPQDNGSMRKLLGDKYQSWFNYYKNPNNLPEKLPKKTNGEYDIQKIRIEQFQKWGLVNCEQNTINSGIAVLQQIDVVSTAMSMITIANGKYAYTATAESLKDSLSQAPSKTVNLDSKTASSDISNSWAGGSASFNYGWFSSSGYASWSNVSQNICSNGVTIEATFNKVCTLPAKPFMTSANLSVDLSDFTPWFYSPALTLAKDNNNNNVWKNTPPTWENSFGKEGNFIRLNAGLVVVDGIKITMTAKTSIEQNNRNQFNAAVNAGYWPFFSASAQGGWDNSSTFNDDGTITITSTSKEGNPSVLGVIVDKIDNVL